MNQMSVDECKKRSLWILDQTVAAGVNKAAQIKQANPCDTERIYQLLLIINHMTSAAKHLQDPIQVGVESGFNYYLKLIEAV
jgi:hypothetical protein